MRFGPDEIVPEIEIMGGVHPDLHWVVEALEARRAVHPKRDALVPHHGRFQIGDMVLKGFAYIRPSST